MTEVYYSNLPRGNTKSCGCYRREIGYTKNKSHGMTRTPTYRAWRHMRGRCYNRNNKKFSRYGGRGITVCAAWRDDFSAFLADMGERPSPRRTLDRIDNDGDYTPQNCRWTSYRIQQNNRGSNHRLTFSGKTLTLADWDRELGFTPGIVNGRMKKGWAVERALTQPQQAQRPHRKTNRHETLRTGV